LIQQGFLQHTLADEAKRLSNISIVRHATRRQAWAAGSKRARLLFERCRSF